jgi:uracil-DNA glycosylase
MAMPELLDQLLDVLASVHLVGNAFNQYSYDRPTNEIRRQNLRLYWQQMATLRPSVLLVGEAPGYRGCRLTGIPFTSEAILLNGAADTGLLGHKQGYRQTAESGRVWKEASATIVWPAIARYRPLPLLWNAFPFHPHRPHNPLSNRPPTTAELHLGQPLLAEVIRLFNIQRLIAVGNKAEVAIQALGLLGRKVRHPSHGGKADFVRQLAALMAESQPG